MLPFPLRGTIIKFAIIPTIGCHPLKSTALPEPIATEESAPQSPPPPWSPPPPQNPPSHRIRPPNPRPPKSNDEAFILFPPSSLTKREVLISKEVLGSIVDDILYAYDMHEWVRVLAGKHHYRLRVDNCDPETRKNSRILMDEIKQMVGGPVRLWLRCVRPRPMRIRASAHYGEPKQYPFRPVDLWGRLVNSFYKSCGVSLDGKTLDETINDGSMYHSMDSAEELLSPGKLKGVVIKRLHTMSMSSHRDNGESGAWRYIINVYTTVSWRRASSRYWNDGLLSMAAHRSPLNPDQCLENLVKPLKAG